MVSSETSNSTSIRAARCGQILEKPQIQQILVGNLISLSQ